MPAPGASKNPETTYKSVDEAYGQGQRGVASDDATEVAWVLPLTMPSIKITVPQGNRLFPPRRNHGHRECDFHLVP